MKARILKMLSSKNSCTKSKQLDSKISRHGKLSYNLSFFSIFFFHPPSSFYYLSEVNFVSLLFIDEGWPSRSHKFRDGLNRHKSALLFFNEGNLHEISL